MRKEKIIYFAIIVITLILGVTFVLFEINLGKKLITVYNQRQSTFIYGHDDQVIITRPNLVGYFATYANNVPIEFQAALINQEDKYFFYHHGINPISLARSIIGRVRNKKTGGSTISQQLAKILLNQENNRDWKNKFKEIFYTIGIELAADKNKILQMYVNSVYFGNTAQGITEASRLYFDKTPNDLNSDEIKQLLQTIKSPSQTNPFSNLDDKIIKQKKENFYYYHNRDAAFEISSFNLENNKSYHLTIDAKLTANVRQIVQKNIQSLANKNTINAAVIILSEPNNELIAEIGSPNPLIKNYGYQINMAQAMRPIGSTIKPLLYLEGFKKNLRPYTLINDREYKYIINDGFSFYPKNYDYSYHGIVNLHYALSNSLNVPSVKVLEYIGVDNFSNWLTNDLHLKPVQNIHNYQLGIALGGLEMDLLSLTYYYSIFTNHGNLTTLYIDQDHSLNPSRLAADFNINKKITDEKYIQLVNKILSDRLTGVEQFGLNSSLNLPAKNYAVKTGTSREYHDSWTIGYTPDFIVGVWVGNSDNTAMDEVSGQTGAGKIWNETMNILLNSKYNTNKQFNFNQLYSFQTESGIESGLSRDDYEKNKNILLDNQLILKPHNNDIFLLNEDAKIILQSQENAEWLVDGKIIGQGKKQIFSPQKIGKYKITAKTNGGDESVEIIVKEEN